MTMCRLSPKTDLPSPIRLTCRAISPDHIFSCASRGRDHERHGFRVTRSDFTRGLYLTEITGLAASARRAGSIS